MAIPLLYDVFISECQFRRDAIFSSLRELIYTYDGLVWSLIIANITPTVFSFNACTSSTVSPSV